MNDKPRIRDEIKAALAQMSSEQIENDSKAAAELLAAQREFTDARSVMIFLPIPGEIDARGIARAAWAQGKRVAVPKIRAPGLMDAVEIHSLTDGLAPGVMNILEPVDNVILAADELDLIIAPALAFDRRGNRLGRGGGYYDRFIDRHSSALVCGLAFDVQLLDEVPRESHDEPVNMLVTNNEFLRFARNADR
jgi:5-formyltetrahydrofolate cyclo-ligase